MAQEGTTRRSRLRVMAGGKDPKAVEFERYYRDSYKGVYNYIYARVLNRADTEDIVSEAYIKAARAFDRFDPSKAAFSTWVITIARNVMIGKMRRGKHEVLAEDVSYDLDTVSTQDQYSGLEADQGAMLVKLLKLISEEDREMVILKYRDGLKNKEIAEILGVNASTVGTRLQRALEKMRAAAQSME